MVAVPELMPVTNPLLLTVATAVLLLLQMPPPVASFSWVANPEQTFAVPVIDATTGVEELVKVIVLLLPDVPQLLLDVAV